MDLNSQLASDLLVTYNNAKDIFFIIGLTIGFIAAIVGAWLELKK